MNGVQPMESFENTKHDTQVAATSAAVSFKFLQESIKLNKMQLSFMITRVGNV